MMSIQIFIEYQTLVIGIEENGHKPILVNTLRRRSILYISALWNCRLFVILLFVHLAFVQTQHEQLEGMIISSQCLIQ